MVFFDSERLNVISTQSFEFLKISTPGHGARKGFCQPLAAILFDLQKTSSNVNEMHSLMILSCGRGVKELQSHLGQSK
jgi:hypothetical protein